MRKGSCDMDTPWFSMCHFQRESYAVKVLFRKLGMPSMSSPIVRCLVNVINSKINKNCKFLRYIRRVGNEIAVKD